METIGAVVIGAGVVGLACARALAQRGIETVILERHATFGTETSARSSEVIHAGLYYPAGSLKAQLCVTGRRLLYDYCSSRDVSHHRCGKLIVASSPAQEDRLDALRRQGEINGIDDLQMLGAAKVHTLEPELSCSTALLSPSTGIVDSHALMLALLGDAERSGATLAVCSPLIDGTVKGDGIVLRVGGGEASDLKTGIVINAAGLSAVRVAASLAGFPAAQLPGAFYAKGNYYALAGRAPFSRLIYPLPEPGGLGVHLTLDLGGQARFGPDVEWLTSPDGASSYNVDPARADRFYAEIRRYWPGLPNGALTPAYSGIRPKISGPDDPAADFLIQGPEAHGIAGLINLFGIESPGLTSSLAIAELVSKSSSSIDLMTTFAGTATRLVLDTNIVMDMLHFANRHTTPLRAGIDSGRLQCFTDSECLAELERVTGYPEFDMDTAKRQALMEKYRGFVVVCDAIGEENYPLPRCRDADDQKFLILGARCRADLLITRDKLLLKLARHRHKPPPYGIVTAEAACALLKPASVANRDTP